MRAETGRERALRCDDFAENSARLQMATPVLCVLTLGSQMNFSKQATHEHRTRDSRGPTGIHVQVRARSVPASSPDASGLCVLDGHELRPRVLLQSPLEGKKQVKAATASPMKASP